MADPLRLYGLKALVTSGGGGIGEAVARTLVKHGAEVLAVDSANSGVEQTFASVKGVQGHVADLRDPGAMARLVDDAVKRIGRVDILVNEFPLHPDAPLEAVDDQFTQLVQTRAELTTALCRAVLPELKKSPAGRIINIGFLRSCFAAGAVEIATRAQQDLAALTRALAADCGDFGITANYVQPGAIMTPQSREVFRKDKELRDFCIANSAAKRVGEPVDVAKVVLFLASDDAMFVSGTGVWVDGGRIAD
ncbi:MAG: SDR family oxidoreductase [Woeseiaceae bacterium]|nr:SDR family oxidoreductase [Woeseiaceae bacterium]